MATVTRIRKVTPLQLGKMLALVYGAIALVIVPFIAVFMGIGALVSANAAGSNHAAFLPAAMGVGMGLFMILFVPILYAGMGFIIGLLGAMIYNLVAKWVGGIEIELE